MFIPFRRSFKGWHIEGLFQSLIRGNFWNCFISSSIQAYVLFYRWRKAIVIYLMINFFDSRNVRLEAWSFFFCSFKSFLLWNNPLLTFVIISRTKPVRVLSISSIFLILPSVVLRLVLQLTIDMKVNSLNWPMMLLLPAATQTPTNQIIKG